MSHNTDIRWIQRLHNYEKALNDLKFEVRLSDSKELSDLEQKGVIQSFEIVHELSWNVLKDYFGEQGEPVHGSRDAFRLAFQRGLVTQGEVLLRSIKSRNKTVHTYNADTAQEIFDEIVDEYYYAFEELRVGMLDLKQRRVEW